MIISNNLDVVFFFYGLAFVVLGIVIILQLRISKKSRFAIFKPLWLLAWFGILHGANEFLDMFLIIKGRPLMLQIFSPPLLMASFLFMFLFGLKVINLGRNKFIGRALPAIAVAAFIAAPAFLGIRSLEIWQASARYFLGFPGALLSALGLILYYRQNAEKLDRLSASIKIYFFSAALFLGTYAFLGGLVVPRAGFFPATVLNYTSFFAVVGLPVQMFRGLCAILVAWSVFFMTNIFNMEATQELTISEEKYRKLVDNALVGVFTSRLNGDFLYANEALAKIYEFNSVEELMHEGVIKRYRNPKDRDNFLEKLKKDSQVSNFEMAMVTCAGKTAYLSVTATLERDTISGMLIDITDRKRMEQELNEKMRELKIVADVAVGRELKLIDLEKEINSLLKELGRGPKYT
ncbi:PAS domain S-box protein [Candidatus Saganbacteria bacterium]|nr:PAS domain S-box protein [Candidatus Saganbacteria bacterium]